MCGIFAYIGGRDAAPILIGGLKRLEYRGYDSAGITVQNKELTTIKAAGNISVLEELVGGENPEGTIGIAHTRWATHGAPSEMNAHPHSNKDGTISLVHNGIIENSNILKEMLVSEGYEFKSDTDTEVLVHLVDKNYEGDLEEAVAKALKMVEGAYGVVVIGKDEKKLVGARKGSPLILGVGEGEYFLSSDQPALIDHTKQVVFLEEGDMVSVTTDGYNITSHDGDKKNRPTELIELEVESLQKSGYEHFMLKEINEQPETLTNTMTGRINPGNTDIVFGGLGEKDRVFRNLDRIIIIACGTSYHAGMVGEYMLEEFADVPVEVELASEFRYRKPIIRPNDIVLAISQSGETADTMAALEEAKERGAHTIGLVNVVGSAIARMTDCGIYLRAGPEIGVASTKAFTSQVIALQMLSVYLGIRRGVIKEDEARDLISEMQSLPGKVRKALELNDEIREVAKKYHKNEHFMYLGRGVNYPVALEGALKLKEISYIHAEGGSAAEMKHGPIALIDKNMPTLFIANNVNGTYDKVLSNMQQVKSRGGEIIAIATEEDQQIKEYANHIIYVPRTIEQLTPILNVIPLQLLAYHAAVLRGEDVDKPRNLAKSVTVE